MLKDKNDKNQPQKIVVTGNAIFTEKRSSKNR